MTSNFTQKILLLLLFGLLGRQIWAQKIVITGTIIDDDTNEAIAFANVYIKGGIGTTSDLDGVFRLEFDPKLAQNDTLVANSLGYTDNKKVFKRDLAEQNISYRLSSSSYTTDVVEVVAGENPANEIMRNIVKNKKQNSISRFDSYKMEMYSKVELDLDNITPDMKDKKMFKNFQFIFDNIDSTSDVTPFLPAYVAERIHDVIYLKSAGERKEVLQAQKVSGVNNQSVVEFIDMMHEKYNIYDNWITLLSKEFISPFANGGLNHYEYYIMDSTTIKGKWSYKLKFKPKRKGESTFFGDFWVSMDDYAIQIANMRMSPDVNINLVNRIILYAEYDLDSVGNWVPVKEKTVIDFSSNDKESGGLSIIGRTTYMYKNFDFAPTITPAEFKKIDPSYVSLKAVEQPDSFWTTARHETLNANEAGVYAMIDSIKNVPIYRTWTNILTLLGSGFYVAGPIEIGEYWNIFNYNQAEGYRLGIGMGTSVNFSKKLRIYGYGGYGLKDHRWKYSGLVQYVFNREKMTQIGAYYTNTITPEAGNSEEQASQSMLSGFLRRNVPPKLIAVREAKVYYQHGWRNGIQTRLALIHRMLEPQETYYAVPTNSFKFAFQPNANDTSNLHTKFNTFEAVFKLRFAYRERVLLGNFSSISLGSKYPIVVAQYTAGIAGVLGSKYNYHKLALSIDDWFNVGVLGWVDYNIEMGKTFGTLPYLLLKPHPGNEAYFYNVAAFNSMNSFEFVSDTYIQWRIEHHMDGLILDRIPLIRKLKWRNVIAFRGVWGTLSNANRYANRFNHYDYVDTGNVGTTRPFYGGFGNMPYLEASAGIENIFKFLRVDALWRLTYRDNPNTQKFSVRVTLSFYF
jgi:hypothetical protein